MIWATRSGRKNPAPLSRSIPSCRTRCCLPRSSVPKGQLRLRLSPKVYLTRRNSKNGTPRHEIEQCCRLLPLSFSAAPLSHPSWAIPAAASCSVIGLISRYSFPLAAIQSCTRSTLDLRVRRTRPRTSLPTLATSACWVDLGSKASKHKLTMYTCLQGQQRSYIRSAGSSRPRPLRPRRCGEPQAATSVAGAPLGNTGRATVSAR